MKISPILKKILILLSSLLAIVFLYPIIAWVIIFIGFQLTALTASKEPRPNITQGEFPFRVEYVVNGETHIIADTLMVEFDGWHRANVSVSTTRSIRWKSWLASDENGTNGRFSFPFHGIEGISFILLPVAYYMGTPNRSWNTAMADRRKYVCIVLSNRNVREDRENGIIYFTGRSSNGVEYIRSAITMEEAQIFLRQFGVEIVSWELPKPVNQSQ